MIQDANDRLNPQVLALEAAQTEIRRIVKEGYLQNKTKAEINRRLQTVISTALAKISNAEIREAARRSLNGFAERQYQTYIRAFGISPVLLLSLIALNNRNTPKTERRQAEEVVRERLPVNYKTDEKGLPLGEYHETYMKRVFDELANQTALDPGDGSGRNSLRNRAEMEVRYQRHQDEIEELRKVTNLVVCSVHADCSDRCAPYQGRVYSLDGTKGVTDDGRPYVPLEEATKNPKDRYITNAGRVYQNGLLGFNCRHKLFAYKGGMAVPTVSAKERKAEYAITEKQRRMERAIRKARDEALQYRGVSAKISGAAQRRAAKLYEEYKAFSRANGRAYYPSRIKIIKSEIGTEVFENDKAEYEKILRKNPQKTPETLESFRKIKYNNYNRYHRIVETEEEAHARTKLLPKYSKTINLEKQQRHLQDTYLPVRSVLTISMEEAQNIVDEYSGKGRMKMSFSGEWRMQETVETGRVIGYTANTENVIKEATKVKIHYSKTGVHIVPFTGKDEYEI